ncbi:hypothetical protein [Pseudomonas pharyngis]|uniref:hypothetical protein n=1 Tax=Pseudomonas pharyngis TaxID=2892333 RepID=UPI001F1AD40D|nr:hypothetical protein [Pseudomonas pharyngis]
MTTDKLYEALGIDNNLKPLPATQKSSAADQTFTAIIEPALPSGTDQFKAEEFWYEKFIPDTISVLGRSGAGEKMKQIAILINEHTPDGTYKVSGFQAVDVTAVLLADGVFTHARKGSVTFKRNTTNNSIEGTADFKIDFGEGVEYRVSRVEFKVKATGPL